MCRLFILSTVVCFGFLTFVETEKDVNCILDESKPASHPGNYMDCASSGYWGQGESTCCNIDGTKVCCSLDRRWNKVKFIAIGVGCTTVVLGMLLFLVLWCKVEANPCSETRRMMSLSCCCCRNECRTAPRGLMEVRPGVGDDDNRRGQVTMISLPVIKVDLCDTG